MRNKKVVASQEKGRRHEYTGLGMGIIFIV